MAEGMQDGGSMHYSQIPGFEGVYLEDSWVLQIIREANSLVFVVDLVLLESHPSYSPPTAGEQYCYRRAQVIFGNLRSLRWKSGVSRAATDASGETDLGSFDEFRVRADEYAFSGDFGSIVIAADAPVIRFTYSTSQGRGVATRGAAE